MSAEATESTFLFTDIEGSTRLWEREPEAMRHALAQHDRLCRDAVREHLGRLVKTTGDGIHAAFADPADALRAVLTLQRAMQALEAQGPLALRVRCGLHLGPAEGRDGDYYGPVLNRAARIMSIAHGGQVLLSQQLAQAVAGRLPPGGALRDLGRVRLRDLSSPERVHQFVHPELRSDFPPLRSLEATPNNLPQQLNSFVGREHDLAEARRLLRSTRLLTLQGMGGIGKSRLSVQLGAELLDDYPDGVWLVELAPLADARLVPQALASVLGVKEEGGLGVTEALLAFVRDRRLLVILDNCEHVRDACAALTKQILQAGSGVQVLASSRDVLQVAGESVYAVPTLQVPDATPGSDPSRLMQHEAVRLFVDRAIAAQGGFRLGVDNMAAVAEICRRLDGIPLALELAAARARALPVHTIAERLSDRFRLLVSSDRTVLPRQRTLRALIDWSFDLLTAPERQVFRRLSVFAGGWTLEAAEAVCAGDGLDAADVMDLLVQLVDKSLVALDPGSDRYRMLETVRAYAAEKLAEAGDAPACRRRHVHECLRIAEQAHPLLTGPEQGRWYQRLDQERENMLAAHGSCLADADGGPADLALINALRRYWVSRGLLELGRRLIAEALQHAGSRADEPLRFRALLTVGWLCYFAGRYDEGRRYLADALDVGRARGDDEWVALALQPLGVACLGAGDTGSAANYLAEAVAMARRRGRDPELVAALNSLAQFHRLVGEPAQAEALYVEALALSRELGLLEHTAMLLLNQAMVSIGRHGVATVQPLLLEALDSAASLGSAPTALSVLEVCAGYAVELEDWDAAAGFAGAATAQADLTGIQQDPADKAFLEPRLRRLQERAGAGHGSAAMQAGRALAVGAALAQARDWLVALPGLRCS